MNSPIAETAIELRNVEKVYRLYAKPLYRVLDLFGLCPTRPNAVSEHAALRGIDLTVRRGEKVAIIGRNGAGKSTLLKIITGGIKPSSGNVAVSGRISALLQIGTGFHPDFTGRQNVYSSLAHAGIIGREADKYFDEVVDFAELHQYIDQPMKTYSTGMGARLMFSASTILKPDILVIDELLGVGDAYFANKSYERMRTMCKDAGTTLLLVTHDLYAALNICERFVWIDNGRLRMDGDGKATLTAYEQSIKEQEEERLRRRNLVEKGILQQERRKITVQIGSRTGFALPAPFALDRLALTWQDGTDCELRLKDGSEAWIQDPQGNLGPVRVNLGRTCRCLQTSGSIFHKAAWTVLLPPGGSVRSLRAAWHYAADEPVEVRIIDEAGGIILRDLLTGADGWQETEHLLGDRAKLDESAKANGSGQYGTGAVRIDNVQFLDANGAPIRHIAHGDRLRLKIKGRVQGALARRSMTILLGFHRPGVAIGSYAHHDDLPLPPEDEFEVTLDLNPLLLGSGLWMVTIGFAEPDFYKLPNPAYFTINDKWHHIIVRGFELEVTKANSLDNYAYFCHPARIEISPASAVRIGNADEKPLAEMKLIAQGHASHG